ncbi:MAG: hypothetical protein JWN21_158 [Sphingomonas bacterium]|uniref:hypothetical protein n=1 Tax=Sphingomonas bacterium TaxID=1895847 RepID=UPI0026126001|nr:hypothetical protein [Sphingomonas bacterium]MDB5694615.1 hypothetical protein [Sphingomonas bacterium]
MACPGTIASSLICLAQASRLGERTTVGDDFYTGTTASETIIGNGGRDTLTGAGGNDTIYGDALGATGSASPGGGLTTAALAYYSGTNSLRTGLGASVSAKTPSTGTMRWRPEIFFGARRLPPPVRIRRSPAGGSISRVGLVNGYVTWRQADGAGRGSPLSPPKCSASPI